MVVKLRHRYLPVNGVRLHVVTAGAATRPAIVLLHGFPDAAFGWRYQIPRLVSEGFFVIAPDLRGANLSSRPDAVNAYRIREFVQDLRELADAFSLRDYALAGHDFGGAVAWTLAAEDRRVRSLSVLNAPHPAVTEHAFRTNPLQQIMSSYIGFLLLPAIPETVILTTNYSFLRACLPDLSQADVSWYVRSWQRPGTVAALIDWYRANMLTPSELPGTINVPVQILWGSQDPLLLPLLARRSLETCADGELTWIDGAGHWPQIDAAPMVSACMAAFAAAHSAVRPPSAYSSAPVT